MPCCGSITCRLCGAAGVEQTIEPVRTQRERALVFGQRLFRSVRLEQNIGQHLAGGDIDLALPDSILKICAVTQVCDCIIDVTVGESDPAEQLSPLDLGAGARGHVGVTTLSNRIHQGLMCSEIAMRLVCATQMTGADDSGPIDL